MFWTLVGTGVALFIYFTFIKPFNYWANKGVPPYNCWNVWVDILRGFTRRSSLADAIIKLYNDFPGNRYIGGYQFYKSILAVRDIDLIKQITVKDFDRFVDHSQIFADDTEPLWERNLLSLKGDKWRNMRATLSPSFTGSKMKVMFGLISECGKQFVQYFQDQNSDIVTLEMKDVFTRFTNDVIASTAFGVKCDSLRDRDNEFYSMGKKLTSFGGTFLETIKLLFYFMFPRLAKHSGLSLFDKEVTIFFKKVVKDNIQHREKHGIVRPDMINLLMEARKGKSKNDDPDDVAEEPEHLTDIDIAAQAMIFFFAGFDTVATLMSFMAHEIAVNPDIQQRLQQEIDDTLAECDGTLTYEAVTKMKYMDMVISESLRKWPAAGILDRVCVKPYTIEPTKDGENPLHLEKGAVILLPVFGIHRDPQFYPEPDRFDPERFSNENKASFNPSAYLPFGAGPRNCIGNRFALMETKLVFFNILANFDITVVEKTTVPLKLAKNPFQLAAEGGFWLGLKRRDVS